MLGRVDRSPRSEHVEDSKQIRFDARSSGSIGKPNRRHRWAGPYRRIRSSVRDTEPGRSNRPLHRNIHRRLELLWGNPLPSVRQPIDRRLVPRGSWSRTNSRVGRLSVWPDRSQTPFAFGASAIGQGRARVLQEGPWGKNPRFCSRPKPGPCWTRLAIENRTLDPRELSHAKVILGAMIDSWVIYSSNAGASEGGIAAGLAGGSGI